MGEALFIAGDVQALDALEAARDALLAAGDRLAAAEAEVSICELYRRQGKRDEAMVHLVRATELTGDTPSPARARVLGAVARARLLAGEPEEARQLANEVLAMADAFDLDESRVHALSTIGTAHGILGDPVTGVASLERALELALAVRSPQASTTANSVGVNAFLRLDFRRLEECFEESLRIAQRFGDAGGIRWARAQRIQIAYWRGRWDEALRDADAFLAECEAGSPHYQQSAVRYTRGAIREALSDPDGALEDARLALAEAREKKDPQALVPALGFAAVELDEREQHDEAHALAREIVEIARTGPAWATPLVPWGFAFSPLATDYADELRDALEVAPEGPWKTLALACLDRDFVRAAEIWAGAGSPTMEARLRLRAGEELLAAGRGAEGEAELAKALAFYRTVDATSFIRRAEALLESQTRTGSA